MVIAVSVQLVVGFLNPSSGGRVIPSRGAILVQTSTFLNMRCSEAAILVLLCGASPCDAFLAVGPSVFPTHQAGGHRRHSTSTAAMMDGDLSPAAGLAVVAAEFDETTPAAAAAAAAPAPNTAEAAADAKDTAAAGAGRRWIKEMKAGDKVIGYVADTTKFAAFVDCSVVRRGAKVGAVHRGCRCWVCSLAQAEGPIFQAI